MRIAVVGATGRIGACLPRTSWPKAIQSELFREEGPPLMRLSRKEQNRSLAASTQVLVSLARSSKMLTLRS